MSIFVHMKLLNPASCINLNGPTCDVGSQGFFYPRSLVIFNQQKMWLIALLQEMTLRRTYVCNDVSFFHVDLHLKVHHEGIF